jgi:hypothetical protein
VKVLENCRVVPMRTELVKPGEPVARNPGIWKRARISNGRASAGGRQDGDAETRISIRTAAWQTHRSRAACRIVPASGLERVESGPHGIQIQLAPRTAGKLLEDAACRPLTSRVGPVWLPLVNLQHPLLRSTSQ